MAKYRVLEKTLDNKNNRELMPGDIVELEGIVKVGKNMELVVDEDVVPEPTVRKARSV